MSEDDKKQKIIDWFDIGTLMGLLVPLLYTAGWSYAYHYFSHYHMGILGLDIPREYYFLYSFWVIRDQWVSFLAAISISVTLIAAKGLLRIRETAFIERMKAASSCKCLRSLRFPICFVLIPVAVLLLFTLFYDMGARTGTASFRLQDLNDFRSIPRVKVWLTEKAKESRGAMTQDWSRGCYRLLLRNSQNIYIFYPERGRQGKLPTEVIPVRSISSVRILPFYHSCE